MLMLYAFVVAVGLSSLTGPVLFTEIIKQQILPSLGVQYLQ
jgi:hypothetical protein